MLSATFGTVCFAPSGPRSPHSLDDTQMEKAHGPAGAVPGIGLSQESCDLGASQKAQMIDSQTDASGEHRGDLQAE